VNLVVVERFVIYEKYHPTISGNIFFGFCFVWFFFIIITHILIL